MRPRVCCDPSDHKPVSVINIYKPPKNVTIYSQNNEELGLFCFAGIIAKFFF